MTPKTSKQEARRARVIQVALELAAEGGYDAVQMRNVSMHADVALGTIYRYFSSKDHLLISAMADWTGELRTRLDQRPPRGETQAEQVVDVLQRACRSLDRQPRRASAFVKALSSDDAGVAEAAHDVGGHLRAMIEPLLEDMDAETREAVITVIGHVWQSTLVGWSSGRLQFKEVPEQLAMTAHLLLDT